MELIYFYFFCKTKGNFDELLGKRNHISTRNKSSKKPETQKDELEKIISDVKTRFFYSNTNTLDPLNLKSVTKQHDPDFWKKVDLLYPSEKPTLIVLDNQIHAWTLQSSSDLKILLSETTGFPFWITNTALSFLTYVDDHDCVHIASPSFPPAIKKP
ncbi:MULTISPECIES: hypothetical protein [unclassified Pseudomonas]|uniref:hypothetical protein n=1 Tax=unclassified Pseudomonas TaxID=196821 RepID=UPI00117AC45E|nr:MULTISPECIES: hypothetical protein [unclassified Pseudomonas]